MHRFLSAALLLVPFLCLAQSETVCIENGKVFDGETFHERTLCMQDGRFVEPPAANASVETIDAAGRFLLPPYAESHTHTFFGGERSKATSDALLSQGVFYALSANNPNRVADDYRAWTPGTDDERKAKVDVLFTNGGFTMTEGHPVPLYRRIHTQYRGQPEETFLESARESVFFQVDSIDELDDKWPRFLEQGSDLVKIYLLHSDQKEMAGESARGGLSREGLTPEVAAAVVRRAKDEGLRVIAHIESAADIRIALDAGVDALAHLPYNIMGSAATITELRAISDELAQRLADTGTAVITTASLGFRQLETDRPPADGAQREELLEANLLRMARAGGQLLVGSDMNSPVPEALALHDHGPWSAAEVLRLWTVETPRWLFPDRAIGRLAPGYEASVIGIDGDPLSDFAAVGQVVLAIKQGVVLQRRPDG